MVHRVERFAMIAASIPARVCARAGDRASDERGAVAVMVAIMLTVMLGITALVVTHDRWFTRGFTRYLIFGANGQVYESPEPIFEH